MNAQGLTAVVLAGGRGTRVAALHPDLPKVLIPAAGQPFLYWVTGWLLRQGVRDIRYATFYRADQVAAWIEAQRVPFASQACCVEPEARGTGGAVLHCLDGAKDRVLIANGDSLVPIDLAPVLARWDEATDGILIGVPMADAGRYGTLVSENGRLVDFAEKRPGAGLVNAGLYLLRRAALERFPAGTPLSMEYDIVPTLLKTGTRLAVHVADGAPFLDIGTPESAAQADAFVATHRAKLTFPFAGPDSL